MALIPDCRLDHSQRLGRMVEQYEKDLLRMCCVYLRDITLAEDAVQDTFLKAHRALDAFRGECSEKSWLMRIAVNVCRDYRRSAWHRYVDRGVSLDQLPEPTAPPAPDHMALTEEIMRLPRRLMEVILLYYYQGLTMQEAAHALGISQAAVSSRLSRARKRLYAALGGGDYIEA